MQDHHHRGPGTEVNWPHHCRTAASSRCCRTRLRQGCPPQTAVGDTFVVEGAAAGAPDVLTAGKSGIPNLAAQAVLGGVAGAEEVLLLPRSTSSIKAILGTVGLASAKEATEAILAFSGFQQMVRVLAMRAGPACLRPRPRHGAEWRSKTRWPTSC